MDSMSPKEEREFVRDMRSGLLFGKWATPIMITVMLAVLGGTAKSVNYFSTVVAAQSELARRVSAMEEARSREADKYALDNKEVSKKLEQQSNSITELKVLLREVRDTVAYLRKTAPRSR